MRPIFWGIILSLIGSVLWVISIVFNVVSLGEFKWLSNILAYIFISGLPIAIIWELIILLKK